MGQVSTAQIRDDLSRFCPSLPGILCVGRDANVITRVIVCGSRGFCARELCFSTLDAVLRGVTEIEIVSGHAKGADRIAEEYAVRNGLPYKTFLPDWKQYGKAAGPRRNREMLAYAKEAKPLVIAFWNGVSRGTKDMINAAEKGGVETRVICYEQQK